MPRSGSEGEIAVTVRGARHIAGSCHRGVLAPKGQFVIAAALYGEAHLQGGVASVSYLSVDIHAIDLGSATVAAFLQGVAQSIDSHILEVEHVFQRGVESLDEEVGLEVAQLSTQID